MGKAIIEITPELLFDILKLDDNFKFVAGNFIWETQSISLIFDNKEIPERLPGNMFERAAMIYHRFANGEVLPISIKVGGKEIIKPEKITELSLRQANEDKAGDIL